MLVSEGAAARILETKKMQPERTDDRIAEIRGKARWMRRRVATSRVSMHGAFRAAARAILAPMS